ncbi:hypothetical protein [Gilvibacter sp.]|uniref:hypothetical protein n=1 Tax=Gilvibacter sp. TaxID=2729997 RepID=UPI0025C1F423|nr:hypothetical protein [Gilvibacter sp.]NQX76348.1 hypothetical protein [Gilvibacter sp.]
MRHMLILLVIACSGLTLAQEAKTVPFAGVELVPIYPDCKGDNDKQRKCLSESISKFINKNFDMELIGNLGLPAGQHRLAAQFEISSEGTIENVLIRGDYLQVNQELERVINALPKMEPGYTDGEAVNVTYALPVIFALAADPDDKKKNS